MKYCHPERIGNLIFKSHLLSTGLGTLHVLSDVQVFLYNVIVQIKKIFVKLCFRNNKIMGEYTLGRPLRTYSTL